MREAACGQLEKAPSAPGIGLDAALPGREVTVEPRHDTVVDGLETLEHLVQIAADLDIEPEPRRMGVLEREIAA